MHDRVVVGTAAVVCANHSCSTHDLYHNHLAEMRSRHDKMKIREE